MTLVGKDLDNDSLDKLVHKLDFDENGAVSYSEFLAGSIAKQHLDKENLKTVFLYLDIFGQRYLTKESLLMSFRRRGKTVEPHEIAGMLKELNIEPGSKITYEQFETILTDIHTK